MKRIFIIILFFFALKLSAQPLESAVGLRSGVSSGITFQYFRTHSEDLKLLLSFRDHGFQVTGLFEHYEPVLMGYYDQFFLYYGLGFHAGITRSTYNSNGSSYYWPQKNYSSTRPVFGADAICGIEYRVQPVPLTFGIDYKPFFEFLGQRYFYLSMGDFALTIKYQF